MSLIAGPRRKRAYEELHERLLLLDVRRDSVLVDPVVVGRIGDGSRAVPCPTDETARIEEPHDSGGGIVLLFCVHWNPCGRKVEPQPRLEAWYSKAKRGYEQ